MTATRCVLYLTCSFLWKMAQITCLKSVFQESGFTSIAPGDKLILRCFYEVDISAWIYWYKQTLGQKPRLVSTFYVYDTHGTFYHEFENNQRFTLLTENGTNHLQISDVNFSDTAIYYCANSYTYALNFAEGTTVIVKSSSSVHQSTSEIIQPGGSVTLNCTVHTGSCDGEHSVYWFKDSDPGIIYTHGDRNDQCERKPDTQTHTCIYNLPRDNLNTSHAGTYYCAVASCGHILFGNGTELVLKSKKVDGASFYILSGALAFTTIVVGFLALFVFKMEKTNNCQWPESQATFSLSTTNTEGQDADNLHYAPLDINLPNRSRRQRNNTECVYSSVKL
ncbi:uncharacterized protein LOC113157239 [Anabas testudineus]|uniref:Ig-like domain-containing protein n=1 Tax=Anabas testudineus TaxID=64144 RepID=A0A3Q1K5W0_ANATE|nr:uncharacterized protein LOC113157239 [Anabas testudineus]